MSSRTKSNSIERTSFMANTDTRNWTRGECIRAVQHANWKINAMTVMTYVVRRHRRWNFSWICIGFDLFSIFVHKFVRINIFQRVLEPFRKCICCSTLYTHVIWCIYHYNTFSAEFGWNEPNSRDGINWYGYCRYFSFYLSVQECALRLSTSA